MWIDRDEYDALKKAAESVKEDARVKPLEEKIVLLEKQALEKEADHKKAVENLTADHRVILERKDAEIETKVAKKTQKLTEDLAKVTMEKNNFEQKANILETAFKNLGFDVKDMKEILNKLVDGIVSKNQIQLINGNGK